MLEEMREVMRQFSDDPELFALMAKAFRKAYDALIQEGFSKDQAMQLLCSQGVGFKVSK
jgi:hypothetical protein